MSSKTGAIKISLILVLLLCSVMVVAVLETLSALRAEERLPPQEQWPLFAFAAQGDRLVSGDEQGLAVLNLVSGEEQAVAGSAGSRITGLALSPDGTQLAALAAGEILLWSLEDEAGAVQVLPDPQGSVSRLAFSPDGTQLAGYGAEQITLWDTASAEETLTLYSPWGVDVPALAFSPGGAQLAALDAYANLILWDLDTATVAQTIFAPQPLATILTFSPNGQELVSSGADGQLRFWQAATGSERLAVVGHGGLPVFALAFSPDGQTLASGGADGSLLLWSVAGGTVQQRLAGHSTPVLGLAFSGDGQRLYSVAADGQASVWHLASGAEQRVELPVWPARRALPGTTLPPAPLSTAAAPAMTDPLLQPAPADRQAAPAAAATPAITALAVSPNGQWIGSVASDGSLRLWTASGAETRAWAAHSGVATGVAFSADGNSLLSVGRDSVLRRWDVATGQPQQHRHAHEHAIRALAVSPNGRWIASGGEETRLMLWDATTGTLRAIYNAHRHFINSLAFSPNSQLLASAGADGAILLWQVADGTLLATLPGPENGVQALAFSQNGRLLASGGADSQVQVWEVASGQLLRTLAGQQSAVVAVAFSPNSRYLVSAAADTRVLVWNTDSGQLLNTLTATASAVTALAFLPNGRLLTGDQAQQLIEWNVESTTPVRISRPLQPVTPRSPAASPFSPLGWLLEWLVPVAQAQTLPDPAQGPGGPLLIITAANTPFGSYYAEILRNEGLNAFAVSDIASVTAATLASYQVVILAARPLAAAQVTMLSDWVTAGGNLVAMRPDPQLAGLLGLTATGTTLAEGYLRVDTSQRPGSGSVNTTLQFHGTADRYTVNGATVVATLYSDATTATAHPAITLHSVGSNGGQAALFAYDLATSVVYTRQGNPAWAAQERDGFTPIRSDDKFYGNAQTDPQTDWVDLGRVAIPQADEQQRLLVNLLLDMNRDRMPLPRFWYFPHGHKAVVIMTGDDHGNGGTAGRFEQFLAASPAGCAVADWECVRGTSYLYSNTPLSAAEAAAYSASGFEVGIHISTNCADFTPGSLADLYAQQIADWRAKYADIPPPLTQRHHCIAWSDWLTAAKVQLSHGIRLDTSYYFWPPGWVLNRPGFFTGSGMPMRFADLDGTLVDVYNAATHMTDESGQQYPFTINTLLDRALGAEGYYGAFAANMHTDLGQIPEADAIIASAQARGVPVVSSRQMLDWLDARNSSAFSALDWNGQALSFTVSAAANARGLQALVPLHASAGELTSITHNGAPLAFTSIASKGLDYAFFPAATGDYVVSYGADTTALSVTATTPAAGASAVDVRTVVSATFSEAINPASLDSTSFTLSAAGQPVAASVSYNGNTRSATLTPDAHLSAFTGYTATLATAITDQAGNPLAAPVVWSFDTGAEVACCTIWSDTDVPANPSENDPGAVELGVKFRSASAGFITGLRFYKGSGNTGTHVGNLWRSDGTLLATAVFSNETATGWQQVEFATPVAIAANTVYVASYHAPNGRYAADVNYFAAQGVTSGPLSLLQDGENGGNGVYAYSAQSAFPASSYQASNYWVDVVFTTQIAPDTTAPTVTATTPADGAANIAPASPITATFSEAINPASLDSTSFTLSAAGQPVAASVSYNGNTRSATLTPDAHLSAFTGYTATLATAITDQAGNPLAAPVVWSFDTGAEVACCTIWSDTDVPANPSENDPGAVELGVKFRSASAGFITGLRFYKGSGNTGTHVGNLWRSDGTLLATAVFSNETATGWQQVEFATPVAIDANTVYVASYHAPNGRYAADVNYFAAQGVTSGPLSLLQDGENGGNGVYAYSAQSAFPASSYQASNYWVDVVFTTTPPPVAGVCADPPNPIVAENCQPGSPASEWEISGVGDASIQGFASDISVNAGQTVAFKIKTDASAYRLDIYRLGYYGGLGARKVASVQPSATLPQNQPACLNDTATGLIDCGNWAVSATWAVPATATSGIYLARAVRSDSGGASHIVFIVRDDAGHADLLFQTADTTWQAYNDYGGNSLYTGAPAGRAYKVSYNRPFNTRALANGQDWLFNAEYPLLRWLEANGYDVSYFTGVDSDRRGELLLNHRVFVSVGHDEYWSAAQRAHVEAARAAGVHLAFFSGNEVFWKTRWENSLDGSGTPYRTLVCYKETHDGAKIDPDPAWTGTWRDPRFSPPADGGRPENALTGTLFAVNDGATTAITVPAEAGQLRFWRHTDLATLPPGSSATLAAGTLGYEWDVDPDNGFRPAGLLRLSATTVNNAPLLLDNGSSYGSGTATHHLTLYRHSSGALVFGAGTVQWAWGLDSQHDRSSGPADVRMQQATVNLLADMAVQPASLQTGLTAATASSDTTPPTSTLTSPAAASSVTLGNPVTVSGTASDSGGVVGAVEVSVDGGATWHPASGRATWSYTWTPTVAGPLTLYSRAVDDSGHRQNPATGVAVTVNP